VLGWKQKGVLALAVVGLSLGMNPSVGADAADSAPTVTTTCTGGTTETTWAYAIDDDMRLHSDTEGWYYVHLRDQSVWKESNNRPGLQITDRVCTERDIFTGAFVRSYVAYGTDLLIADATPGIVVWLPDDPPIVLDR